MCDSYEDKGVNSLLLRCRNHDELAFAQLLERYTPMLNKLISSFLGGNLGYDELYSEASLALHVATMRYDLNQDKVSFGLYARICIQNKLIDLYRRNGNEQWLVEGSDVELLADDGEFESRLIARETVKDLLAKAKGELSEYEYRVLMLHAQGYKTAAIAARLGKTAKSVDNAKFRLFRHLRELLGTDEY